MGGVFRVRARFGLGMYLPARGLRARVGWEGWV